MNLIEILQPECIEVGASLASKTEALRLAARLASSSPALVHVGVDAILAGLEQRESLGSTGFGKGIAIPHCRLDSISQFVAGAISVPAGVAFDSLDSEKVRIIIFTVGPSGNSGEHIRLLSQISRVLSSEGAVGEMVGAESATALRESFLRHLSVDSTERQDPSRTLFRVFVQDEEMFNEILQIFGGTEPRATVVVEAENASSYLCKMPLFAGLWSDGPRSFSRLITSIVRKNMTNEIVRRIESITGPLNECENVLVTVQDVIYCGGHLET
ncbi:PTS sugar transporter subunit IIA [bacterium]|nr:PTS sugar transporter subunit IIA [bacterium]